MNFINKIPKKLFVKAGIYVITNNEDDRVYVGSTINFLARFKSHRSKLLNKKHHCVHFQHFYDKHVDAIYSFSVVKIILNPTKKSLENAENKVMNLYGNKFNTNPVAYSMLGFRFSEEQTIRKTAAIKKARSTPEQRELQREHALKMWATNGHSEKRKVKHYASVTSNEYREEMSKIIKKRWENPEYKERVLTAKRKTSQSAEYKAKVSVNTLGDKNPNRKLNSIQVKEIKELLLQGVSSQKLSIRYFVSKDCIGNIKTGKTWKHIII